MKNLTKIILPLITSTFISISSHAQEEKFEDFDEEEKMLYKDFKDFIKKNHTQDHETYFEYDADSSNALLTKEKFPKIYAGLTENKTDTFYIDHNANGMKEPERDQCILPEYAVKKFGDFSPSEKLKLSEGYNSTLRRIMHNAKYEDY